MKKSILSDILARRLFDVKYVERYAYKALSGRASDVMAGDSRNNGKEVVAGILYEGTNLDIRKSEPTFEAESGLLQHTMVRKPAALFFTLLLYTAITSHAQDFVLDCPDEDSRDSNGNLCSSVCVCDAPPYAGTIVYWQPICRPENTSHHECVQDRRCLCTYARPANTCGQPCSGPRDCGNDSEDPPAKGCVNCLLGFSWRGPTCWRLSQKLRSEIARRGKKMPSCLGSDGAATEANCVWAD